MCRFLETIKVINGECQNLEYHVQRFRETRRIFFGQTEDISLESLLKDMDPDPEILYKLRIVYDDKIQEVTLSGYEPKQIRKVKLVDASQIDYSFKYADREAFTALLEQAGDCDEIILTRNGFVTDASYANLIFFLGDQTFTPDTPLLNGTKRQLLLDMKVIKEMPIKIAQIKEYSYFGLINAMLDPGDITLSTDCIE